MITEVITKTPDCEIESSRIFSANRELVFRAWSEPNHLKNWWGPAGFTNTFNEFDFRVGGKWRFIMHGPDKGNYVNECEFIIIETPSRIAWQRISKPIFQVERPLMKYQKTRPTLCSKCYLILQRSA